MAQAILEHANTSKLASGGDRRPAVVRACVLPAKNTFVVAVRAKLLGMPIEQFVVGLRSILHGDTYDRQTLLIVSSIEVVCKEQSFSINNTETQYVLLSPYQQSQSGTNKLGSCLRTSRSIVRPYGFIHYYHRRPPLFLACCVFSPLLGRLRAALARILRHSLPVAGSNH